MLITAFVVTDSVVVLIVPAATKAVEMAPIDASVAIRRPTVATDNVAVENPALRVAIVDVLITFDVIELIIAVPTDAIPVEIAETRATSAKTDENVAAPVPNVISAAVLLDNALRLPLSVEIVVLLYMLSVDCWSKYEEVSVFRANLTIPVDGVAVISTSSVPTSLMRELKELALIVV